MSQSLSTTPRRSAGAALNRTWLANSVAARSAGYTDASAARRAGIATVAGLVTLGGVGASPIAAHAEGSRPAGATTTTIAAVPSSSSSSSATTRHTTVALNVRTGAGTQYSRVTTLPKGTSVNATGTTSGDWTQIDYNGAQRWVATRYLTDGAPHAGSSPAGTKTTTTTTTATATKSSASVDTSSLSATRAAIVKAAYSGVGSGYVYGGTSFGAWDCSGFTQWAFAKAGISLPRTSYAQPGALRSTSNPQPGDLVLQNGGGHVGIYVGNGMMISALNPREGTQLHPVSWMPVSGYYSVA